jgi:hypothetical protein
LGAEGEGDDAVYIDIHKEESSTDKPKIHRKDKYEAP